MPYLPFMTALDVSSQDRAPDDLMGAKLEIEVTSRVKTWGDYHPDGSPPRDFMVPSKEEPLWELLEESCRDLKLDPEMQTFEVSGVAVIGDDRIPVAVQYWLSAQGRIRVIRRLEDGLVV